ncbi:MAG: hypothetical protein ACRD8A_13205 [Candidatus Acidiferrales bacterium]
MTQADNDERIGLCATCVHARQITSDRGAIFWMCGLSATDSRFPKYPPLPVVACVGYWGKSGERGNE